ncbi:hypothetical protein K439DRAFT_1640779 [Ramaria rubella]|nr:hypothetical protein K439DRAFT_1640779 [Ramaria rubella]
MSSDGEQIRIIAGKLFDSYTRQLITDQLITINPRRGIITDVRSIPSEEQTFLLLTANPATLIDLRQETVLPGFVDVHVHFFLHPYSETSWDDQLFKESIVERTVRAVTHAKRTLLAGFTTVRDLGTEGAADADISLRKCLSGPNPIIPGPRYFCANRALVTTGSYGPKGAHHPNVEGIEGITGAEAVDGMNECRKAVRRQIGAGADWIKIYGDYTPRSRLGETSSRIASAAITTFQADELNIMISTATALGVKTAIHLKQDWSVDAFLRSGTHPHSVEHGIDLSTSRVLALRDNNIYWVPTLSAYYTLGTGTPSWEQAKASFQRSVKIEGLKIACGGDTGVFAHGDNALEMKLMVQLGADWTSVLQWATLGGWECVRGLQWEGKEGEDRIRRISQLQEDVRITGDNDMPFGAIKKGFAADIISTRFDLEENFDKAVDANSISFVMKGGKLFKRNGKEVPG